MALDKLVDSSKLDAALNYEANRILAKTGGSAPIAFDFANEKGFGDVIDTISGEGVLNITQDSEGYLVLDSASNPHGGGEPTYFDKHGIMYKENMVIPEKDSTDATISTPRYVRDAFEGATYLKSYIQQYGTPATDSDYGLFRNCINLETVWVARATFGNYCFDGCAALKTITLGRVGIAVTSVQNGVFNKSVMTHIETITVYVNASDLSGVPSAVKDRITPSYSSGAVITYKNYESGGTIATVTVP